jgi:molybdenum cofactor cytidylyltransferase
MRFEIACEPADGDSLLLSRALRLTSSALSAKKRKNSAGTSSARVGLNALPPQSLRDASIKSFGFDGGWEGVAFVGAGGKTTAIFQIARELPPPMLVTTTTHLGAWQSAMADQHIIAQEISDVADCEFRGITLITGTIQDDRLSSIREDILYWLRAYTQKHNIPLLIEADGSRQKELKAPNETEPVIPQFTEMVVVVAGLSGIGKPLNDESVHRPHLFSTLSGISLDDIVTPDALLRVLTHPNGGLKNIPPSARRIVFLNQADSLELQAMGGNMSASLLQHFDSVVVGSLRYSRFQTFERTAGMILAAGASTRFGEPKQLLDWRGEPFIRVVTQTALNAGLSPVVVVTGANADEVESRIKDLPVIIARNESWQSGQASSVRAGINALLPLPLPNPPQIQMDLGRVTAEGPLSSAEGRVGPGSAIFLLADQPQIKADVIRALIEHHAAELYPIVAPLVMMEQRANPVLFDRVTFPDLLALEGDVGGRAIFSKYSVEYLPWHDDRLLLDVDKPEDYQRLIEDDTL